MLTDKEDSQRVNRLQQPDRSNDRGIAERTRQAVQEGRPFTQAQMLGNVPMLGDDLKEKEAHHR